MALLSGFKISLAELQLTASGSMAAFAGGTIPAGWNVVTPQQLGLAAQYQNGNYFTDPSSGASAIVLQQGTTYMVSFRGTDGNDDVSRYPELFSGAYINHFQPLLSAVASNAPAGTDFYFTGASLGGGATNQMANIASSQYGGRFASAKFVAFASPNISTANGILNVGVENDPVYKAIANYGDFSSSLDNMVLAKPEYMAGNYDGRHPFDTYAHSIGSMAQDVLARLSNSIFYNSMSPDSVIIFDAVDNGPVQDITPGRENTGAFYLGQSLNDQMIGRAGNDFLEGFDGNDALSGGNGDDMLAGGSGADQLDGGAGNDTYFVDNAGDVVVEGAGAGTDLVNASVSYTLAANVENLTLLGTTDINGTGNSLDNVIIGDAHNNTLDGAGGADTMIGGAGDDSYFVDHAGDVVTESPGEGNDTVYASVSLTLAQNVEYLVMQGTADLQGYGNGLVNVIYGNTGSNILDGGAGGDAMYGGAGNDFYYVDNVSDLVIENPGEGNDTVFSSANLTLGANIEYLNLTGSADLQGYGNSLVNVMYGNTGSNILDGAAGGDAMYGGAGNDFYYVDNISDLVIENANEGNDTVFSSANLALGANIEYLNLTGSADLQGYGNSLVNVIYGNTGNNIIDGGTGGDAMYGGAGNDFYYVDNISDLIIENPGEGSDTVYATVNYQLSANAETLILQGSGNLQAYGGAGANTIFGNSGSNLIDGGAGADTLQGFGGSDVFVFRPGQTQGDTVVDFSSGVDALQFAGFGAGATFTQVDAAHWEVNYSGGATHEMITFNNLPAIQASDFAFV